MVMPFKCPFCDKTYGDAEEHYCEERKAWENTLVYHGQQAGKALREFSKIVMEEAEKSRKTIIERIFKKCIDGKSAPSKDDN